MIERFVEQHAEMAFHLAFRLCGNVEDAKELVQEAFVRAITRWEHASQVEPTPIWLQTVLRHLYYDGMKRHEKRYGVSLDAQADSTEAYAEVLPSEEEPVLRRLERQEDDGAVLNALDSLRPEYRAILLLNAEEGLGYEEMAEVLDCPLGTVRSRLNRARDCFKKALVVRGQGARL